MIFWAGVALHVSCLAGDQHLCEGKVTSFPPPPGLGPNGGRVCVLFVWIPGLLQCSEAGPGSWGEVISLQPLELLALQPSAIALDQLSGF